MSDTETPESTPAPPGGEAAAASASDRAAPPEGWLPYSIKRGPRCATCGDLRTSPAGCPACRPELAEHLGELKETLEIKPKGYAPSEFLRGAGYLPRGAWFLARNPRLWRYAAAPLLINLVVACAGFALAVYLSVHMGELGSEALNSWQGGWSYVAWVLKPLLWLSTILLPLLVPLLLAWLLTAFPLGILYKLLFTPFMEALGGATDRALLTGGHERHEFQTSHLTILYTCLDALVLGLVQGIVIVVLLPILLVPLIGGVIWMVLPPSLFASMDFSDIHLVRRGYEAGEKLRLWWTHHWRFLGYGASFFFLLSIPILNALAIPVATVGGAMLYLELERK